MIVLTSIDDPAFSEALAQDQFFWLDLEAADTETVNKLAEQLKLHPIAAEDMHHRNQRPKVDSYGDYTFLVFYGADTEGNTFGLNEVQIIVGAHYLVTLHQEPCEEIKYLITKARETDQSEPQRLALYRVLDGLADSFFPVLSSFDDEIDELEDAVFQSATDDQLQRLFQLKRSLVQLRKVVTPQRDMLSRIMDQLDDVPGFKEGADRYLRDVYDHMIRISDLIDSYRDLLTGALDVYLSTVSNRMNDIMKRLTLIATIFLPLTFVTGFFGQNFEWLVRNVRGLDHFLIYGVGGLVVSCIALVIWFKRARFL